MEYYSREYVNEEGLSPVELASSGCFIIIKPELVDKIREEGLFLEDGSLLVFTHSDPTLLDSVAKELHFLDYYSVFKIIPDFGILDIDAICTNAFGPLESNKPFIQNALWKYSAILDQCFLGKQDLVFIENRKVQRENLPFAVGGSPSRNDFSQIPGPNNGN